MDVKKLGLDVSDAGSNVSRVKSKGKKIPRQRIEISSDEEDDEESIESRSVVGDVTSDVEQARIFLWSQASNTGQYVVNGG